MARRKVEQATIFREEIPTMEDIGEIGGRTEAPEQTDGAVQTDIPGRTVESVEEKDIEKASIASLVEGAKQHKARKTDVAEDGICGAVKSVVKKYDFCNRNPSLIHMTIRAGPQVDVLMDIDADTVKAAWNEYKKYDESGDQESFMLLLGELVGELGRTYYHVVHVNLNE